MNQNSGEGLHLKAALAKHLSDKGGKIFVVAKTAQAGRQILQDLFKVDEDGVNRYAATISAAIGYLTASRGDVIVVAAGHTETISAAAGVVLNKAGATIIGLGVGNNRPVLTFGTSTAASFDVTADNCEVRNIVGVAGIDGLTKPFNVTGDNCILDIEWQDASASIEAATVVRLDTANNSKLKLKYLGFIAGNAAVRTVAVDDCDNVDIEIDAYGVVSTAWVNMVDAASSNVKVRGRLYTSGITNSTRLVVDTVTGSTWDAIIYDSSRGVTIEGGSAEAFAVSDVASLAATIASMDTKLDTIDNFLDTEIASILEDTGTTLDNLIGTPADTDIATDIANVASSILAIPRSVQKADGAVLTGNDNLFVITGGPVRAKIVGIVDTIIGGASNGDLQIVTTSPAGTVTLNAAPVAIDTDAAGTLYYNVGATSIFTPVTVGAVILDPVTVEEAEFILPPGTVHFRSSAAQSGVIKWYMSYIPLSQNSRVAAAA